MTTLEIFLAILGIIAIVLAAGIVLFFVCIVIIKMYDRNRKKDTPAGEKFFKDTTTNTNTDTRELYYKEEKQAEKPSIFEEKSTYDDELARKEQAELMRLREEEAKYKQGMQPKKEDNFDDFDFLNTDKKIKTDKKEDDDFFLDFLERDNLTSTATTNNYNFLNNNDAENDYNFLNNDKGADASKLLELEDEIKNLKGEIKKEKDSDEKERMKQDLDDAMFLKDEVMRAIEDTKEEQTRLRIEAEEKERTLVEKNTEIETLRLQIEQMKANEASEKEKAKKKKEKEEIDVLKDEMQKLKEERDLIEQTIIAKLRQDIELSRVVDPAEEENLKLLSAVDDTTAPSMALIEKARLEQEETMNEKFKEIEAELEAVRKGIKKEKDAEEKARLREQLDQILAAKDELIAVIEASNNEQLRIQKEKDEKEEELKKRNLELERLRFELEQARSAQELTNLKLESEEVRLLREELDRIKAERTSTETEVVSKLREELEFYKSSATETTIKEKEIVTEQVFIKGMMTKEEIEKRIEALEARAKENDKQLRKVRREYSPLNRVRLTLETDMKKLRRREAIVAKQSVALYGVNNYIDIDDTRAKKLNEDYELLEGLRASVKKCEEILVKNKDRLPILENSYKILKSNEAQINADIEELKKQLTRAKD